MVPLPFFLAHAYIDHSHNGVSQYSRQRALLYEVNTSFSELPGKKVFYNGLFYATIAP
jgi:hypothetical protein